LKSEWLSEWDGGKKGERKEKDGKKLLKTKTENKIYDCSIDLALNK